MGTCNPLDRNSLRICRGLGQWFWPVWFQRWAVSCRQRG